MIAVKSYYKSYKRHPSHSKRRKALFFSAFLSYRFQDYKGALEKFEEFILKYKKSHLTPHAYWYVGWIKYLQKNFNESILSFKNILQIKERKKGSWNKISEEKLKYWLAMSYTKNQQFYLAKKIFQDLMSNTGLSYYSILSLYRYNDLQNVKPVKNLLTYHQTSIRKKEKNRNPFILSSLEKESSLNSKNKKQKNSEKEEKKERNPDKEESDLISDLEEDNLAEDKALSSSNGHKQKKEEKQSRKRRSSSLLQTRFERARDLSLIGAFYWARWELYEMEIKTKKFEDFKRLVEAYKHIKSFHRSAYISTVYFGEKREMKGILGERDLWENAFPKAYHRLVHVESNNFGISKELIWSIMRAESKYRSDITSPVGAEGLMQIMPATAKNVAEKLLKQSYLYYYEDLKDPRANIKIGTRYLKRLLKKFENQIPLAAASYNAGPHRVRSWLNSFGFLDMDAFIEHIPFLETRKYVKKVVRNYKIYQYLYTKKIQSMNWLIQPIELDETKEIKTIPREIWDPLPH